MAIRRGRGVAAINYPTGMNLGGDPSQALVHSTPTGNFMVTLSSVDLGQGLKQVMAQICAETIGVKTEQVIIDTARHAPHRQCRDPGGQGSTPGHA
jgi:CO/xanthine dehydrogenase Mo-binding subunit